MNICYCHTCKKDFQSNGIARHRAMHRDKKQDCKITFTHGDTYSWKFSESNLNKNNEQTLRTKK